MEGTEFTISQISAGLRKKEFSALELTRAYLDNIKEKDGQISAFLTVIEDSAFSRAKAVDDMIAENRDFPILAGVPLAVKDNILVKNVRCTAASKMLETYIAPYNATVIEKLENQGAVILGKTNLDEFAMGSSTENSAFGPTKNPNDITRVPGGSSGGSAAAVAAQLCCYALGSDTGGSIRLPASFCGIVGLKPTYGSVSRYGLIAMASSLDQIGPLCRTVEDCKIVFDAIRGQDDMDSTSVEFNSERGLKKIDIKNLKIGIPKEYFRQASPAGGQASPAGGQASPAGGQAAGMDKDIEKIIREAIKKFENQGAKIEEISLPYVQYALPAYYIIMPCEASSNLARYDSLRYGKIKEGGGSGEKSLLDYYLEARDANLGEEVKRRIMLGTYALSAGYYEAFYLKAQKVRTKIKEDFEKAFQKVDVILSPTSPNLPFKIGEKTDPLTMYLSDIFMVAVNLAGLPAISLPCGKIGKLPVGLQIIGNAFEEQKILEIGGIFEKL